MSIPNITFPLTTNVQIKVAVETLNSEIQARQSELNILKTMRSQCQQYCKHEGQQTGYNERDGSWGNPCPTCGYSY
jgi:hypothetical protein